jgi:predicted nuclease of predicted toxin-antitoxin system
VKLLLDENLSDKIVSRISDLFPDCTHVKSVALMRADDAVVADWARHHGFAIVSKDTDFYQRSVALGSPPKFVWLRVGNSGTEVIVDLLRSRHALIRDFIASKTESVFVLERRPQTR